MAELFDARGVQLYTSDAVLGEVLTRCSRFSNRARAAAVELVRRVRAEGGIRCVHLSSDIFDRATNHYEARSDKTYSFVDCASMVICEDNGIAEVLTHDDDFRQEGLQILL